MASNFNSQPTQNFVPIKEVRDGILTLKDGSLRSLIMVSSVNFYLKSADEQQATIYQFQNFLNSLDFDTQIFIESKRLDIRPYIALLEEQYKKQIIDLMKIQIREYINFIRQYTEERKIMTKSFFVVVPLSPGSVGSNSGFFGNLFGKKGTALEERNKSFEENRAQIEQRIGVIQGGLNSCGLRSVVLGTEELVEMFYKIFNPGDTEKPIKAK
jgi:type IV secretory pathway VirB4 component